MLLTSADKSASDSVETKVLRPWLRPWTNSPHRQHSRQTSPPKWPIRAPKQSSLHIFRTRASTKFKALKINLFHNQMPGSFSKYCRTSKTPVPKQTFLSCKVLIGSSSTNNRIFTRGDLKSVPISPCTKFLTMPSLKVTWRLFQDSRLLSKQTRSSPTNLSGRGIFSDPCNLLFRKWPISIPSNSFLRVYRVSSGKTRVLASIVIFRQATATSMPISVKSPPKACNSLKLVSWDILVCTSSKLRLLKDSCLKYPSHSTSCNSNVVWKMYRRKISWSFRDLP